MRWELAAIATAAFVFLALQYWRQRAATRRARQAIYDDCLALVANTRLEQSGTHFPTLTGHYRDKPIRLDAIIDSATVRKLPSVWLQLNIVAALPIDVTFDFLVRPLNTEFFSPAAQLPIRIELPPGWPQHAMIKADRAAAARLLPLLDSAVPSLFADVKCKELLITPKGLRLVYQLAQAERADYLVLRAMVFDHTRVPSELFGRLLDALLAIHAQLSAAR